MYKEIFDGLPGSKQEAIRDAGRGDQATSGGVEKPGYYLTYFPGQQGAFESAYLRVAMHARVRRAGRGQPRAAQVIIESLEGSLKRVGTDHFDILMCPHGADLPEDLASPEIAEVFEDLKQQGKVRFLGVTSHNDPAGVLRAAADAGHYDAAMMAYNVINGGYVDAAIRPRRGEGRGRDRDEGGARRGHAPQVAPAGARVARREGRADRAGRLEAAAEGLPLGACRTRTSRR